MRRLALTAGLGLTLAGCALTTEPVGPQERWGVSDSPGEGVKLVLGVPDSDDVRMMMVCRPRSGRVELTVIGRPGDPAVVELRSGKVVGRYAGAGVADEESGGMDIELKLPVSDPVLTHLAATGELEMVIGSRRTVLPNAFAPAHDFVAACRPR